MIEHEARLDEGWKSHVRNAWLSLKTPVQVWPNRQKLTCSYPLTCHQQTLNIMSPTGKALPITPCPWFKSLLSTGHPRARSVSLVPRLDALLTQRADVSRPEVVADVSNVGWQRLLAPATTGTTVGVQMVQVGWLSWLSMGITWYNTVSVCISV